MLYYDLGDAGLSEIRFGISPLSEMTLSLRAVKEPSHYPLQLPWLSRTQQARASLDMDFLLGIVNHRQWTPDFLTPRPSSPLTRVDDEFAELSELSPAHFTQQLELIHGQLPSGLSGPPRAAMRRMVGALREYWDICFAPHWPRMRTILEADITYRGRVMAQAGLAEMLNDISASLSFEGSSLNVRLASVTTERRVNVDGRGIMLVPTMFTRRATAPVDLEEAPVIRNYRKCAPRCSRDVLLRRCAALCGCISPGNSQGG